MIVTLILGILCVLFAWLEDYKNFKFGLKISFGLIFIFLALRYDFGNDYMPYYNFFYGVEDLTDADIHSDDQHYEIGWIYLNKLFYSWGFFALQTTLAILNCIIYYFFIRKYCPKKYYWFSIFLYIFSVGIMLTHSSAMRQSIVIGLFVFSIDFLYQKKFIKYFAIIFLASLFHTSALILFPLILLGLFQFRINNVLGILIIIFFFSLFIYAKDIYSNLGDISEELSTKYEVYNEAGAIELGSGLGLLFLVFLLTITIYYDKFQTAEASLVFKLAMLSFMFIPFGFVISLIGRLGMYFTPTIIVVYPLIIKCIEKKYLKSMIAFSIIFVTMYDFFMFFQSDIWKDAFGTYKTFFSLP